MSSKIWYEDIVGTFAADNYYIILPTSSMTLEEKLNAIVRFFVYLGVLLALVRSDYKYLFFGIIAGVVSIVLYNYELSNRKRAEKFLEDRALDIVDNKVCARTTVDNPFMNPSIADLTDEPDRPAACRAVDNPVLQTAIEQNFSERLFKDANDIYGREASQRQFYTVPSTTYPNEGVTFAEWLYGRGPTCKEENGLQCERNQHYVRTS